MSANKVSHLSVRTLIFSFGWSSEKLIELLKMDLLAVLSTIKSPDQQRFPMDPFDRGDLNVDNFILRQKRPGSTRCQILEFHQMFELWRWKFRDMRAGFAAQCRTELLAVFHCEQFRLNSRYRSSIRQRRNLFAGAVGQIRRARWFRIND